MQGRNNKAVWVLALNLVEQNEPFLAHSDILHSILYCVVTLPDFYAELTVFNPPYLLKYLPHPLILLFHG